MAYGRKVYGLGARLRSVCDSRRSPKTPAALTAAAVFFAGLLRIRSFNALEPRLKETPFIRLVGAGAAVKKLCSADTISRSLKAMDVESARSLSVGMVSRAERNKVFREGWHGALRYVALDGWEPICSYHQHCPNCLVRQVKVRDRRGKVVVEVAQYYHRYVVAMLIGERFDLVLDFEPLLPCDLRPTAGERGDEDEGELTAAYRLLPRIKRTYRWLDVVVADGLYANGPFLTLAREVGLGVVVIVRKEMDEPLKEAFSLWGNQPAEQTLEDPKTQERIELWDCPEVETLDSYQGPIRVVRGRVTHLKAPAGPPGTWCLLTTGKANRLSPRQVLAVGRGRWHIENTGFHQWTTRWRFNHVFVHDGQGIRALYWLFFGAFNLLTLFLYQKLRSYGRDRGKDPTRTISRLIDEMLDDLARMDVCPWNTS